MMLDKLQIQVLFLFYFFLFFAFQFKMSSKAAATTTRHGTDCQLPTQVQWGRKFALHRRAMKRRSIVSCPHKVTRTK